MSAPIRIVIAEDHSVVREGLKILIRSDPQLMVAGEASSGRSVIELVDKIKPDVVLMDLAMPDGGGLDATRGICSRKNPAKVLVLSAYQDEETVEKALEAGASGFLTKHSAASELLEAIRQVCAGKQYFSSRIVSRVRRRARSAIPSSGKTSPVQRLTPREREVLVLIAEGMANKTVAYHLDLSIKTVEKHRQQIMDKLNIHEVAGLTRYAIEKGLVSVPWASSGPLQETAS